MTKEYDGENYDDAEILKYQCKFGMKFSDNFGQTETQTTCDAGNNEFTDLTETCVPSKIFNKFIKKL